MPKYSVPITTKTLDVYVVDAKNGSDAAFKAAGLVAENVPPTHSRELSRQVGSAKPLIEDDGPQTTGWSGPPTTAEQATAMGVAWPLDAATGPSTTKP